MTVVDRLDDLLGETLLGSVSEFLEEMKTRHIANIEACDRLADLVLRGQAGEVLPAIVAALSSADAGGAIRDRVIETNEKRVKEA